MSRADLLTSRRLTRSGIDIGVLGLGVVAVVVLARVLGVTGLSDATSGAVTALVLISLGMLTGGGITCLCQLSFAAIGAWAVSQLSIWDVTGGFFLWLLIGGLAASLSGALVGLASLRIREVNLAIVTLAFAAMVDSIFATYGFPGSVDYVPVAIPGWLTSQAHYLEFAGCVTIAGAGLGVLFWRSRAGRTLRCLRQSERAAAALGRDVARVKLLSFGLSAFVAGIAGGISAGQVGVSVAATYSPVQSLSLFAIAMMIGVDYIDGAVIGAVVSTIVPNLLSDAGLPPSWSLLIFGALTVPALRVTIPPGEKLRLKLAARLKSGRAAGDLLAYLAVSGQPDEPGDVVFEVENVTVRYGALTVLEAVGMTGRRGEVVGLIGPNGAGKSTLVDVLSGFVTAASGSVRVAGQSMNGWPPHLRARGGMRRTFQQDRVPLGLRVGDYVRLAVCAPVTDAELESVLAVVGAPPAGEYIVSLDSGARRLVELAGALLAKPAVLALDEPTAGLGMDATARLGGRLAAAAAAFGICIVLIEHDLDVIRAACSRAYVLDYGHVIAEGKPEAVLRSEAVSRAYLGDVTLMRERT